MNRRHFLAALLPATQVHAQSRPPNILIIVADDLGWGDLSINGCPDIRTPYIDSIAKEGVRFTQSYANAPECTPTRCALLTGRYQHRVGGLECAIGVNNLGRYDEAIWLQQRGELGLPPSETILPRMLKNAGYDTACIGKWHLGYAEKFRPPAHGFDHWFGILGGNADYFTHEEQGEGAGQFQLYENAEKVKRPGYLTDLFGEAAVKWVAERTARPFFLYLAFTAPHSPIQAAEDFDKTTGTAPHRNAHRPTYVQMVERLDARVGDVLRQLERSGVSNDTIVVFTSDNGADGNGRNEPFRGRKSSVWEGGIRSPLHIRWPRIVKAGTETAQVVMTMDIAPTLCSAVRIPRKPFDGHDLLPVITGEKRRYARSVFWRYRRGAVTRKATRHGDWKYVNDSGQEALHDLSKDPSEHSNLIQQEPETAVRLKRLLAEWEHRVASPRLRGYTPSKETK